MPGTRPVVHRAQSATRWLPGFRLPLAGLVMLCAGHLGAPMLAQAAPATKPRYTNKPRVRREWRTLSEEARQRVARAFWTLKTVSEEEGQAKYGRAFHNYDHMLLVHACTTVDPRCDQGHFGPHLLTFHRLWLLKVELALLAVDPSIEAMPYWDLTLDAINGTYRNDPDKYIFTDKFFGSYTGTGPNYAVTDGLFAYWPIAQFSEESFGQRSEMAKTSECISAGYFKGTPASVCDRCCLAQDSCTCGSNDTYRTNFRKHDDCTPWVTRQPNSPSTRLKTLAGHADLVYSDEDYKACTDPQKVQSWMQWQLCAEASFLACYQDDGSIVLATSPRDLPPLAQGLGSKANSTSAADACSFYDFLGHYKDPTTGRREYVHALHSVVHSKLGGDMLDMTTSPNDVGVFTGHHGNIDRSNLLWAAAQDELHRSLAKNYFLYPSSQQDFTGSAGDAPYGFSGPYSAMLWPSCNRSATASHFNLHGGPWINGTLLEEVVSSAFSFTDLFNCSEAEDCSGRTTGGYTHAEAIYWLAPERAPYTYDTLEHLFYELP